MTAALPHTRAARAWRGGAGAVFATVCAAASHAIAGGQLSFLALIATTVVALPVCVALAGRLGSLWRTSVAVIFSQGLFHWSFASIGSVQTSETVAGAAISPHAHHLADASFSAQVSADALVSVPGMWVAHAIAALLTIALLSYGERAALSLGRALQRSLFGLHSPLATLGQLSLSPVLPRCVTPPLLFSGVDSITHRGPPRAAHPTICSA